jgi:GDP-4-dehydro-6-deoxy-D-mannose reductase
MRSLITGVDGFLGSWLGETLVAVGDAVVGVGRRETAPVAGVTKVRSDITDSDAMIAVVRDAAPDRVFHLAALNNIAQSIADPAATVSSNVTGTVHVLEAMRIHVPTARLVSVGSSAEYGRTSASEARLREGSPLAPTSPYGVSKVAQGQMCGVYASIHGLSVVHVRPFAVIGPRKRADAVSDFCRGVVAIERGLSSVLRVGDLEAVRDFVDVRDCVAALVTVSNEGKAGDVVNLCGGNEVSLGHVVDILRDLATRPVAVNVEGSRKRRVDDRRIVGDPTALARLGWAPRYSLRETLEFTLDYWRGQSA